MVRSSHRGSSHGWLALEDLRENRGRADREEDGGLQQPSRRQREEARMLHEGSVVVDKSDWSPVSHRCVVGVWQQPGAAEMKVPAPPTTLALWTPAGEGPLTGTSTVVQPYEELPSAWDFLSDLIGPARGYPHSVHLNYGLQWKDHPLLEYRSCWNWFQSHRWELFYRHQAHGLQHFQRQREAAAQCLQKAARSYLKRQDDQRGMGPPSAPRRRLPGWRCPTPDPKEVRRRRDRVRRRKVASALRAYELPAVVRLMEELKLSALKGADRPPSAVGLWRNRRNRKWHTDLWRANKRSKQKKKKKQKKRPGTTDCQESVSASRVSPSSRQSMQSRQRMTSRSSREGLQPRRPPAKSAPGSRRSSLETNTRRTVRSRFSSFSGTATGMVTAVNEDQVSKIVNMAASTSPAKPSQAGVQITSKDVITPKKGSGNVFWASSRPTSRPTSAFSHASRPQSPPEEPYRVPTTAECMPSSRAHRALKLAVDALDAQVDILIANLHSGEAQNPMQRRVAFQWAKADRSPTSSSLPTNLAEAWDRLVDLRTDIGMQLGKAMGSSGMENPRRQSQLQDQRRDLVHLQNQVSFLLQKVEANWLVAPDDGPTLRPQGNSCSRGSSLHGLGLGIRSPTPPVLSPHDNRPSSRCRSAQGHRQLKSPTDSAGPQASLNGSGTLGLRSFKMMSSKSNPPDDGRKGTMVDNSLKEFLLFKAEEDGFAASSKHKLKRASDERPKHPSREAEIQMPIVKNEDSKNSTPEKSSRRNSRTEAHAFNGKASNSCLEKVLQMEDLNAVGQKLNTSHAPSPAAVSGVKASELRAAAMAAGTMIPPETPKYAVTVRPRSASAAAAAALNRKPQAVSAADRCRSPVLMNPREIRSRQHSPETAPFVLTSHDKAFVPKLANHATNRDFGKYYKTF